MQSTSLAGHTILVVEDEPVIALDITTACEVAGAAVLTAVSLGAASHFVEWDGLSAAVLDFGFKDGDANALCGRLNERDIPYVLHSGYHHLGDKCHRGIVVEKPANPDVIVDVLGCLIGGETMGEEHWLLNRASTYGPERLKVLGQAFDAAWDSIASTTNVIPTDIEATRTALARIIISLPCSEVADAERITETALQVMAAGEPDRSEAGPTADTGRPDRPQSLRSPVRLGLQL